MVIQTKIHDGISIKTRTLRNFKRNADIITFRENVFFPQSAYSKWGVMTQLRGNKRILWGSFGRGPNEINH